MTTKHMIRKAILAVAHLQVAILALPGSAQTNWASDLGVSTGATINSGYLFNDGVYIDTPYSFVRQGTDIYINGELLKHLDFSAFWPPSYLSDPGPFTKVLTTNSTLADLVLPDGSRYDAVKASYLATHMSGSNVLTQMAAFYAALPFVSSVTTTNPVWELVLHCVNGENLGIDLSSSSGESSVGTTSNAVRSNLVARLESYVKAYEHALERGCCVLAVDGNIRTTYPRDLAVHKLPLVVEILRSNRSTEEKTEMLKRIGWFQARLGVTDGLMTLVTGFQASTNLEARLAAEYEGSDTVPMSTNDVPDQVPDADQKLSEGKFYLSLPAVSGGSVQGQSGWYENGASVTITAVASNGWEFRGWMGDIDPAGTTNALVTVTMDRIREILAVFKPVPGVVKDHLLYVAVLGEGSLNVPQVSWHTNSAPVLLVATPADGWHFAEWEGCIGTGIETNNPTTVLVNGTVAITALFKQD